MANGDLVDQYVCRVLLQDTTLAPWNTLAFLAGTQLEPVKLHFSHARTKGPGSPVTPARMVVTINDRDAVYDPANPDSALYGLLVGDRAIKWRCSSNLYVASRQMCWGYVTDITPVWQGRDRLTQIVATDGLRLLGQYDFDDDGEPFNQYELTGERIARVLSAVGWPAGFTDVIEDGVVLVPPEVATGNALAYCQELARTEGGTLFMNNDGKLEYREHNSHMEDTFRVAPKTEWWQSQCTITDEENVLGRPVLEHAPTTIGIGSMRRSHKVVVSGHTGTTFTVGAAPSATWPPTTRAQRNLKSYYDADVYAAGKWWHSFWKYEGACPEKITMRVHPNNADALTAVAAGQLDLLNRVTVIAKPFGYTSAQTWSCLIESVEHTITPFEWVATFGLSPYSALPAASEQLAWGESVTSTNDPAW